MDITRINHKCHCESLKHLYFFARQTEKKVFCGAFFVTGDKKWIYFNNLKRKKSWVDPGQPSTSKRNIYGYKTMLCIWWDMQGVVYYELFKLNESITGDWYQLQLNHLNKALFEKRPAVASNRRKVTLLHDNT